MVFIKNLQEAGPVMSYVFYWDIRAMLTKSDTESNFV